MAQLMTQTSNFSYYLTPKHLLDKPYKSIVLSFFVSINVCISAFYVGYSLAYISTFVNFSTIIQIYHVQIGSEDVTESLVTACVPIGAIFGALGTSLLLKIFSRKQRKLYFRNTFFFTNGLVLFSCILLFFQYSIMIFIGRLFQGICVGVFSAIVPLYINEFVPKQLKNLGALNQFFIAFGQSFAFLLYFILTQGFDLTDRQCWRFMVYFTLGTTLIQTIVFIFVFPFQTPQYWLSIDNQLKARQLLKIIYHQSVVEQILDELFVGSVIIKPQTTISAQFSSDSKLQKKEQQLKKFKMSTICIIMAIHVALYQQLTGINAVALYGGKIVKQVLPDLNKIIPILTNLLPAIAAAFTIPLMRKYGRKALLQIGGIFLVASLLIISIGFFVKEETDSILPKLLIVVFMFVYMGSFGLTLGPIVWLYIPQIVQARIIPYSTMANLIGATVCVLVFPIASKKLPNQAYLFIIFMLWGLVSLIINKFFLVQTKQKSRQQVYKQFQLIQNKLLKKE